MAAMCSVAAIFGIFVSSFRSFWFNITKVWHGYVEVYVAVICRRGIYLIICLITTYIGDSRFLIHLSAITHLRSQG